MLNLPKVSKTAANYANILAQSQNVVDVSLRDTKYYLSFFAAQSQSYEAEFLVEFKADSRNGFVLLKSFYFEEYLKSFFPNLNVMNINQEVKLVLLDLAFEDVLTSLKATWKVDHIEVVDMIFHPEASKIAELFQKNLAQFPFTICDQSDQKRDALLMMDEASATYFIEDIKSHIQVKPSEFDLSRLYTSILLSLGSTKLTVFDLYRLIVGDVILIHSFKLHEDGFYAQLWSQGQSLFLLNVKDQDIIVEKKMDLSMADEEEDFFDFSDDDDEDFKKLQEMISQDDSDDSEDEDDIDIEDELKDETKLTTSNEEVSSPTPTPKKETPPVDESQKLTKDELKHMQIKLNFVIDSQVMSFEELQKLSPGHHLNLDRAPTTNDVSILANGKDFAKGELVQIEGKVGVKITKINI